MASLDPLDQRDASRELPAGADLEPPEAVGRVGASRGRAFALWGGVVGGALGLALLLSVELPPTFALLTVLAGTAAGYLVGCRLLRDVCSECGALLEADAKECFGCGGIVVAGAAREERLATLERIEEETGRSLIAELGIDAAGFEERSGAPRSRR